MDGSAATTERRLRSIINAGVSLLVKASTDEPDVLRAVRAELRDEFQEIRARRAVEGADRLLSVGRVGLGLVAESGSAEVVSRLREFPAM